MLTPLNRTGGPPRVHRGFANAFDSARGVEARSLTTLLPYLRERAFDGQLVFVSTGTLSRYLQRTVGDVLINLGDRSMWSIEIKAELEKTGNFFFETWSNRNLENRASHALRGSTRGWLDSLKADLLFYHFVDDDELYAMNLFSLKRWAFGCGSTPGQLYQFPEVRQSKYSQLNDTWGRIVPIEVIEREVGLKLLFPTQLPLFQWAAQ